jgi:hypothetical protein
MGNFSNICDDFEDRNSDGSFDYGGYHDNPFNLTEKTNGIVLIETPHDILFEYCYVYGYRNNRSDVFYIYLMRRQLPKSAILDMYPCMKKEGYTTIVMDMNVHTELLCGKESNWR